ncbi:MAG: alpha/beta hydrolase [Rhodobacteraceae bacterium]|nr:alpha/beta hydrolase [Paracoccaceae bacterium]
MPKRSSTAKAPDRTSLRYAVWGPESASKRAALVHSLAMTAEFWEPTVAALGTDWQVLALDCRGHGASGKPDGPYSVELFADDLASVLDHAGWEKAIVGGASMGGCVALAFGQRHAERATGLALIDTTSWYGEDAEKNWETRGQKALADGMAALTEFQQTRWFSDAFRSEHPDAVQDAIDVFVANDVAAYLETCRMLGRCDMRGATSTFTFPVEIVVGEEDYATPVEMAKAMARQIPQAKLEVLESARHFTPLEVPDRIAACLKRLA